MPEPNNQGNMTFDQYSVLISTINNLRDEVRANNSKMDEMLRDHEQRIRRTETLTISGLFLIIIVGFVLYVVLRVA